MAEVFHLTHDAGDYSEYSAGSDGQGVSLVAAAGMNGTPYGLIYDTDDVSGGGDRSRNTTGISGVATSIRLGWYLNLNTLDNNGSTMWELQPFSGTFVVFSIIYSSGHKVRAAIVDDDFGSQALDSSVLGSGQMTIECEIVQSSALGISDGECRLYVNSSQVAERTDLKIFTVFSDFVGGGSTSNINNMAATRGGVTGTFYIDEIILRDDSIPVFFAGYDLVLGGGQP